MAGIDEISIERKRQLTIEGWSAEHDDQHTDESLALAAALYATPTPLFAQKSHPQGGADFYDPWPWRDGWGCDTVWDNRTKHDRRRQLVIAGALIAAEIDRLDRAEAKPK